MIKPFLHNSAHIRIRKLHDCPTSHILSEFLNLGKACPRQFVSDCSGGISKVATEPGCKLLEKIIACAPAGGLEFGTDLKPPPRCAVEELAVIRGSYQNHMGRQSINLRQQGGYDALDLDLINFDHPSDARTPTTLTVPPSAA